MATARRIGKHTRVFRNTTFPSQVLLSFEDTTQDTGDVVIYDRLDFTVVIPFDGRTTTSLELYDGVTLVGTFTEFPNDTWVFHLNVDTAGVHDYQAKRIYAGGETLSNVESITALDILAPDEVTSATLLAWFRCPESIQLHTQLRSGAANVVTISAASGLNGRTENIFLVITTAGLPGVGLFHSSIDGGQTFLEASPVTIPTAPGNYTIPGTDIVVNFQQGINYALAGYTGTIAKWLDKVGAFPNSTNNLINDGTSPDKNSRPRVASVDDGASTLGGSNRLGVTALRIDALLGQQGFMWCTAGSLATDFSGTDVPFGFFPLLNIKAVPTVTGDSRTFICVSNLTDTDTPRISTAVSLVGANTVVPTVANSTRKSDTGVDSSIVSGAGVFTANYLIEDTFDGTLRRTAYNATDLIGGDSTRVVADQSGKTITTTRFVLGVRQTQAGKQVGGTFDIAELPVFDGPLSDETELWQLRAYFLSTYPSALDTWFTTLDVNPIVTSWDAWIKNQTASFGVATNMIDDPGDPTSIKTRYGYRAPRTSINEAYPGNWYLLDSGDPIAEQETFLDQQEMLAEVGATRMFLFYGNRNDFTVGPVPAEADIYDASIGRFLAMTTPHRNAAKFCLSLQPAFAAYPGAWENFPAYVDRVVSLCLLDQYLRLDFNGISNRPVIQLYYSGIANDWNLNLARKATLTTAITDAGLGAPIYVSAGTTDSMGIRVAASNTLSAEYFSGYFPAFGAGHQSYASLITNASTGCKSYDNPSGLNAQRALEMAHCVDDRPRNAGNPWSDQPTYTELEKFERDRYALARSCRFANFNGIILKYNCCEIDEAMVFFPSEQTLIDSVNTPARGIFLDAMKNVRSRTFPSDYTDAYTAWTFHANVGGSLPAGWAIVQDLWGTDGGLTGSYQYAVLRNSTNTNARTWTVTTTGYRVYATLGPGLGHIGFTLDGGAQVDVNQDDGGATTRYNQLVYDSGPLSNASHTLAIARISGQAEFCRVLADMSW